MPDKAERALSHNMNSLNDTAPAKPPAPPSPWRGLLRWSIDLAQLIRPTSFSGRVLMLFPALSAAFTIAVLLGAFGVFDPSSSDESVITVVLLGVIFVYNLLAPIALACLISLTSRQFAKGMPVVAVGCLAFTAATAYLLVDTVTSENSSTGGVNFLFIPITLGVLLIPFGLLGWLLHFLVSRFGRR